MKLSDLRPCDNCNGKLAPIFYILKMSVAVINPTKTNQTLGLAQQFQGNLVLAEVMGVGGEIAIGSETNPELEEIILLCNDCRNIKEISLGLLAEKSAEFKLKNE